MIPRHWEDPFPGRGVRGDGGIRVPFFGVLSGMDGRPPHRVVLVRYFSEYTSGDSRSPDMPGHELLGSTRILNRLVQMPGKL